MLPVIGKLDGLIFSICEHDQLHHGPLAVAGLHRKTHLGNIRIKNDQKSLMMSVTLTNPWLCPEFWPGVLETGFWPGLDCDGGPNLFIM